MQDRIYFSFFKKKLMTLPQETKAKIIYFSSSI